MRKLRREGVQPAYMDETRLDFNHVYRTKGEWVDSEGQYGNNLFIYCVL
jgi:hypothetical protein